MSTTTDLEEIIPTEMIDTYVQAVHLPVRVGLAIAWSRPGKGSIPVRFPRWNAISVPAGTKSEGSDFNAVAPTTTESSITPGIVGFEVELTDEVMVENVGGVPASLIDSCLEQLANRLDVDVLASSTSANQTTGTITDTFGRDNFAAALAAWRVLEVPQGGMGDALVLDHGPMADLERDMVLAVGTTAGMFAGLMNAANGYKGNVAGVEVFESGNVAAESSGMSNFITKIGMRASGLGIVFQELPHVRPPQRATEGERSASTFYVFRAWYGAGLTNPNRLLEVLSAA